MFDDTNDEAGQDISGIDRYTMPRPARVPTSNQLYLIENAAYDFFGVHTPSSNSDPILASVSLLLAQPDSTLWLPADLGDSWTTSYATAYQAISRPGSRQQQPSLATVFPALPSSVHDEQEKDTGIVLGATIDAFPDRGLPSIPSVDRYSPLDMSYLLAEHRLDGLLQKPPLESWPRTVAVIPDHFATLGVPFLRPRTISPTRQGSCVPSLVIHTTTVPSCDPYETPQVQPFVLRHPGEVPSAQVQAPSSQELPLLPVYQFTFMRPHFPHFPESHEISPEDSVLVASRAALIAVRCQELDVKPHKCRSCDYCTSRKHDLTRHEQHHSGIRRFRCLCCDETFSRSDGLGRHLRQGTRACHGSRDTTLDSSTELDGWRRILSTSSTVPIPSSRRRLAEAPAFGSNPVSGGLRVADCLPFSSVILSTLPKHSL